MPVAVNQIQRREEKDPLDTIMKGLSIAGSIYGIKDASAKADQLRAQTALQTQQAETQKTLADKQMAQIDRQERGVLTTPEYFSKAGTIEEVAAGTEGAAKARVIRDGQEVDVYYRPIKQPKEKDPLAAEMMRERLDKMTREREEKAHAKTPQGRLDKLNSSDRQRFDNVRMGLGAIQGMSTALLEKDQNTFSLFGDNDFTQKRAQFEEALGRMQSQGAINDKEVERFKNMAPTFKDSPQMQRDKLVEMQKEFMARFNTLGFKDGDLGLSSLDISALQKNPNASRTAGRFSSGLTPPSAHAGTSEKPQTVIQNGHTYTLNPKTGKYE